MNSILPTLQWQILIQHNDDDGDDKELSTTNDTMMTTIILIICKILSGTNGQTMTKSKDSKQALPKSCLKFTDCLLQKLQSYSLPLQAEVDAVRIMENKQHCLELHYRQHHLFCHKLNSNTSLWKFEDHFLKKIVQHSEIKPIYWNDHDTKWWENGIA